MNDTIAYTSGTFEMATVTGEPITTKATLASNGLCYHATPGCEITRVTWQDATRIATQYASVYTVSHVASGRMLCGEAEPFKTEEQCRQFIVRIDGLADWSSASPVLSDEIKQQAYACRDEVVRKEFAQ